MPLRDHFRPPISELVSWEGFHALWPGLLAVRLNALLPAGFRAEPRVHLGPDFEVDVAGFRRDGAPPPAPGGGTATVAAPRPTHTARSAAARPYEYEVHVYNQARGRTLVAAVEIVSPSNKDRPDNRRVFAAKCATLVRQGVCVAVVDVVTEYTGNLYADALDLLGASDPALGPKPPGIYAAAFRGREIDDQPTLEMWSYPVALGSPLPDLPLWLTEDRWVQLELEAGYEATCAGLAVP